MKANELIVGDWVYSAFAEHPCKVEGIEWTESEYAYVKISGVDGYKCIESLSSILLTPEILEKNGFIKQGPDGWEYIHPNDSTFSYIGYRILWRTDYDNHLFIKKYKGSNTFATLQISYINFVHQLQQALRLCGIEKEIVL